MKFEPKKDRYPLPSDFAQVARLSWRSGPASHWNALNMVSPLDFVKLEQGEGLPALAAVLPAGGPGGTLAIWPVPDREYEVEIIYVPQWKRA